MISFSLIIIIIQIISIQGITANCQKNKVIDYNQVVETICLIETCIVSSTCSEIDDTQCECKRDYVVRYNVTIEQEDDDHDVEGDKDSLVHLAVITQGPVNDSQLIIIGNMYPCFYDERDVTTVFWARPHRKLYFILLSLSLILVFGIILVPIIYVMVIIEFTNPKRKKDKT